MDGKEECVAAVGAVFERSVFDLCKFSMEV